jgi:hypothetical protein
MAFQITPPAHLIATAQGRKFAVFVGYTNAVVSFGLFEYMADGWRGEMISPASDEQALKIETERAGGVKNWLIAWAELINNRLRQLFSGAAVSEAVSGSPTYSALLNELQSNWKMTVGPDGVPVFGPK